MAINFKNIAQQETVISDIMTNRSKVDKTDGKVHICDFDLVSNANGEVYAICAISESQFINGGFVLTRIFSRIVEEYHGNIEKAREDFRDSAGLDVELKRTKTRGGRSITQVTVL